MVQEVIGIEQIISPNVELGKFLKREDGTLEASRVVAFALCKTHRSTGKGEWKEDLVKMVLPVVLAGGEPMVCDKVGENEVVQKIKEVKDGKPIPESETDIDPEDVIVSTKLEELEGEKFPPMKEEGFEGNIGRLEKTFKEMDGAYKEYAKTHDSEKLNLNQAGIRKEQRETRDRLTEIVEDNPSLKEEQIKEAKNIAARAVKNLLLFYTEQIVGKRAWLTGISEQKAREIHLEVKDKYADDVEDIKKKIKDKKGKKASEEEIKEETKKEVMFNGFKRNRAEEIIIFQEKRKERIKKIQEMLEQGEEENKIKKEIKEDIHTGSDEFKELRAEQLIERAK